MSTKKSETPLHFLEEVPEDDHLELLQDEVDPVADEEGLVHAESLRQQQQVPLTTRKQKWELCSCQLQMYVMSAMQCLLVC